MKHGSQKKPGKQTKAARTVGNILQYRYEAARANYWEVPRKETRIVEYKILKETVIKAV